MRVCRVLQNGFDEAFLKDSLLERIKDDEPEVVMSALTALEVRQPVNAFILLY